MLKKHRSGLILYADLPAYVDTSVLLMRPGMHNFATLEAHSGPKMYGLSCSLDLAEGQHPLTELIQSLPEHFGAQFAAYLQSHPNEFRLLDTFDSRALHMTVYGFYVLNLTMLATIRLPASTGGFHPLGPEDEIDTPTSIRRRSDVLLEGYEKEAVAKVFKVLQKA